MTFSIFENQEKEILLYPSAFNAKRSMFVAHGVDPIHQVGIVDSRLHKQDAFAKYLKSVDMVA
jgi:hypothetical protein